MSQQKCNLVLCSVVLGVKAVSEILSATNGDMEGYFLIHREADSPVGEKSCLCCVGILCQNRSFLCWRSPRLSLFSFWPLQPESGEQREETERQKRSGRYNNGAGTWRSSRREKASWSINADIRNAQNKPRQPEPQDSSCWPLKVVERVARIRCKQIQSVLLFLQALSGGLF